MFTDTSWGTLAAKPCDESCVLRMRVHVHVRMTLNVHPASMGGMEAKLFASLLAGHHMRTPSTG